MTPSRSITRRTFLADLGRGGFALAVVTLAACAPSGSGTGAPTGRPSTPASPDGAAASPSAGGNGDMTWERVDLGFVSAYLLVRGGEVAVVDTGTAGSEGAIETSLGALGLGWANVGHVILTHLHGDHAGSTEAVMAAAPDATGYAGTADLEGISAPRALTALEDGDRVFDLLVIATPGHTPGSICVLDEVGGILVAGDALGTDGGQATGPNERFTPDMATALQSVSRLGALSFETLLVGHGDPIVGGASAQVASLGG